LRVHFPTTTHSQFDELHNNKKWPEWWNAWTENKFHTYLVAFRKSVARDDKMSLHDDIQVIRRAVGY